MAEIIRHSETCKVQCVSKKTTVEAVIIDFKEHILLHTVLNKTIKLNMVWNGTSYEGRGAGLDFTSAGPYITRSQSYIRGH